MTKNLAFPQNITIISNLNKKNAFYLAKYLLRLYTHLKVAVHDSSKGNL